MLRRYLPALAAFALFGCAQVPPLPGPQGASAPAATTGPGYAGDALSDPIRLFKVAYPLLRAAHDLCRDASTYGLGLYALNRFGMGRFADQAWRYGIGDEMKVLYTVPDGPAYKAGIRTDDVVLSINGQHAPTDARSTAIFSGKMSVLAHTGLPVEFTLRRDGRAVRASVHPEPICGYNVRISQQTTVNAIADGSKRIAVSRGMMHFAGTDVDLALVLSHEIAHNALDHLRKKMQLLRSPAARASDTAPDRLNPIYSRALEAQADYVGLYIMARAGVPIEDTPELLERMAAAAAARGANAYPASHPPSKQRLTALHRTIREIEHKRAIGAPLEPDLRRLRTSALGAAMQ